MKYLIITANFAPRGASPAVRTVHIVKYLHVLGNEVQVLTYDEDTLTLFSAEDCALARKVPESIGITRIPGGWLRRLVFKGKKEVVGGAIAAKARYLRNPLMSLLVPDPHVDSVARFIREGKRLVEQSHPDVVITHSYPFSMHWVGAVLKQKFPHIFWIADYGDPWVLTPISELPTPGWRKWLDYKLEKKWLNYADAVSVTTVPTRELYKTQFPNLKNKIVVTPMGYDPDDFRDIAPLPRAEALKGKLLLVHTGRIYQQARDPRSFVAAMEMLARERPELFNMIMVVLVGDVDDYVQGLVSGTIAERAFTFIPWVPVQESIAWMKAADWLLLFGNKGGIQIPGKVFQYIGSGKPILMTKLTEDDPTIDIVRFTEESIVVCNDGNEIFEVLKKIIMERTTAKEHLVTEKIKEYSWPNIVSQLAEVGR